jgi:hypothetical protein
MYTNILVAKPERKKPFGRPRRTWKDNIRIDLKEVRTVGNGFMWFGMGTGGALLLTR